MHGHYSQITEAPIVKLIFPSKSRAIGSDGGTSNGAISAGMQDEWHIARALLYVANKYVFSTLSVSYELAYCLPCPSSQSSAAMILDAN